jgi:hypothetical protein
MMQADLPPAFEAVAGARFLLGMMMMVPNGAALVRMCQQRLSKRAHNFRRL